MCVALDSCVIYRIFQFSCCVYSYMCVRSDSWVNGGCAIPEELREGVHLKEYTSSESANREQCASATVFADNKRNVLIFYYESIIQFDIYFCTLLIYNCIGLVCSNRTIVPRGSATTDQLFANRSQAILCPLEQLFRIAKGLSHASVARWSFYKTFAVCCGTIFQQQDGEQTSFL